MLRRLGLADWVKREQVTYNPVFEELRLHILAKAPALHLPQRP
jgi:hypothetical protein